MLKTLAAAVALALVSTLGFTAGAGGTELAVYQPCSVDGGVLSIQAEPLSRVTVRCECADGSYSFVGGGQVDPQGNLSVCVPHRGPESDGQPQYVVNVMHADGSSALLLGVSADTKPLDDLWWLD